MDRYSTDYTAELLRLVRSRRDLLQAIAKLTTAQHESTVLSEVDVTIGILARKDSLLDQLTSLQQSLRVYHEDNPEDRRWESPELRAECQALSKEGDVLLARIIQLESETIEEITMQRDAVSAQLQQGKNSQLAHNAYTAGFNLGEGSLDLRDL